MSIIKHLVIIAAIIAMCNACNYIESINKEGEIVSKDIHLQPFKSIIIEAPYQITIIESPEHFIHLEGMDYLIDGVNIEQVDSTIYLKHETPNSIQKSKMIKMYIYTANVQSITTNAPGQLYTSDTLHTSNLSIVINGGGTYFESDITIDVQSFSLNVFGTINTGTHTISGKAQNAYFLMEGCTYAYADKLICQQVTFTHKSAANCYVTALSKLNATLFSGGNLYYGGNPEINFNLGTSPMLKATGQLLPIGN